MKFFPFIEKITVTIKIMNKEKPLGMEILILLAPSILEKVVNPPQLMAAMLAN